MNMPPEFVNIESWDDEALEFNLWQLYIDHNCGILTADDVDEARVIISGEVARRKKRKIYNTDYNRAMSGI